MEKTFLTSEQRLSDIAASAHVECPFEACPDFEFLVDDDEIDAYSWKLVQINILDMFPEDEMDETRSLEGETPEMASERWALVRKWMTQEGGAAAAIAKSPIIGLIHDGDRKIMPVDGWHRCVVAFRDYGLEEVTALIGVEISPSPEP